jgi:integration host factor subunit alpha
MFKRNLNRKALANTIHQNIGFSKIISENIVNDIFYIIISAFKENEKVKIASFGTFQIRRKNERIGRNPKTKEKKIISARKVITFRASKLFKDRINQES